MKNIVLLLAICSFVLTSCRKKDGYFELSSIINDNMVIQQNSTIKFWGKANPGVVVNVAPTWAEKRSVVAGADSIWETEYATPAADHQCHEVHIYNKIRRLMVANVVFGEVWLAVGQGNLALSLKKDFADRHYADTALTSSDEFLRFYNIDTNFSSYPAKNTRGMWIEALRGNEAVISATEYYFARQLRDSLKVPIGVINAAISGTACESWTSRDLMLADTTWGEAFMNVDQLTREYGGYERWLSDFLSVSIIRLPNGRDPVESISVCDEIVPQFEINYNAWDLVHLPTMFENTEYETFDGVWWFVKRVNLPSSWIGKDAKIYLGKVDDRDKTYINGLLVGEHNKSGEYDVERIYDVPSSLTRQGYLNIAVRVTDSQNEGGFLGAEGGMRIELEDGSSISIEGQWRFRVAAQYFCDRLYFFDIKKNSYAQHPVLSMPYNGTTPTVSYNGMIAPIVNYKVAGLLYNQGETNSGNPRLFEMLIHKMVASFRTSFHSSKMPVILVQLAPSDFSDARDERLGAKLREAQRRACDNIDRAYLVSLMDVGAVGEKTSVPKKIVGTRAANMALARQYDFESLKHQFLKLKSYTISNNLFVLNLENGEELVNSNSKRSLFEVAGSDSIYYPATIITKENSISIFSHMVSHPKMARYAYNDTVIGNVSNSFGMPLSSFCTERNPYQR